MNNEIETFDDLLTWACWYLMESFTRGESLRRSMHHIVQVARSTELKNK